MRALAIVALVSTLAHADEKTDKARAYFERGRASVRLGEYEDAIRQFEAGYQASPRPLFLYNLAIAARRANHPEQALSYYRRYLDALPSAPERKEVLLRIAELEALEKPRAPVGKPVEPPPPVEKPAPPPAPVEKPAPPPVERSLDPPAPPPVERSLDQPAPPPIERSLDQPAAVENAHPGRAKKLAGLAIGIVGLAALGAGIGAAVIAKQAGDDLRAAANAMDTYDPSVEQRGHSANLAAGVLLGVGGAAVVAGIVSVALGYRESKRARAQVAPSLGPRSAGASLTLGF